MKNDSSLSEKKDSGEGGCSSTRKSAWIWTLGPGMQVMLSVKPLLLSFSHQVTTVIGCHAKREQVLCGRRLKSE